MAAGQLCQLRWVLIKGTLAIRQIVKYLFMIIKSWLVNCEVTVEENKCQSKSDTEHVS